MVRVEGVVTGLITPVLAFWLADELPRKELSSDENMKRTRNVMAGMLAGVGIAVLSGMALKKLPEEWQELSLAQVGVQELAPAGV